MTNTSERESASSEKSREIDVTDMNFPVKIIFGDKKYLLIKSQNERLLLNKFEEL